MSTRRDQTTPENGEATATSPNLLTWAMDVFGNSGKNGERLKKAALEGKGLMGTIREWFTPSAGSEAGGIGSMAKSFVMTALNWLKDTFSAKTIGSLFGFLLNSKGKDGEGNMLMTLLTDEDDPPPPGSNQNPGGPTTPAEAGNKGPKTETKTTAKNNDPQPGVDQGQQAEVASNEGAIVDSGDFNFSSLTPQGQTFLSQGVSPTFNSTAPKGPTVIASNVPKGPHRGPGTKF